MVDRSASPFSQMTSSLKSRSSYPLVSLYNQDFDPDGDVVLILSSNDSRSNPMSVRLRASSKHLSLASDVFRAMLSKNFKEGAALKSTGIVEIPLPDDDPFAMSILLNVIHGRSSRIPFQVPLERLTQIAILVDKYRTEELIAILAHVWTENLRSEFPLNFNDEMRRWIFVSWALKRSIFFLQATQSAQSESTRPLDEYTDAQSLPIPESVIRQSHAPLSFFDVSLAKPVSGRVDESRQKAVLSIIDAMHAFLESYQGSNLHCTSECDAMVLGTLTKGMKSIGLLVRPTAPFKDMCFKDLAEKVRGIPIKTYCDSRNPYPSATCTRKVKGRIDEKLKVLEAGISGVSLLTLMPSSSGKFDSISSPQSATSPPIRSASGPQLSTTAAYVQPRISTSIFNNS